jgi:tetratricopeptide (TPR) repeat protein
MYKFRSSVLSSGVLARLVSVSLVFLGGAAVGFGAQQAPPQTEEERQARDVLNKGVQDFNNGQYDEAIAAFRRARELNPQLLNARLYLATAYAAQYIPGAPSEANQELGRKAVEEFREVLAIDPQNLSAIDGIGSIVFQMAGTPYDVEKFKESKSYHQKHIEIRPNDAEPYYWVGVIDWMLAFHANSELRTRFNEGTPGKHLNDDEPLPPVLRTQYEQEFGATIDEGIESMKKAIALRPDYDDAMVYLNLEYRRKADTVNYQNERDELLKMADDLVDKVKEIKRRRAEQPSQP